MDARELEGLSREELIRRAERVGVFRPFVLTKSELIDEILRCQSAELGERGIRGLFGMARDLLADVVERSLHLPEAAAVIRGSNDDDAPWTPNKPPLSTVTLAEIYAAQGHRARALAVLDQILASNPDHEAARTLREKLLAEGEAPTPEVPDETVDEVSVPQGSSAPLVAEPPSPPSPERPVPMLDDEPLPPRYEVDEVVALAVDPRTLYVYWEIRRETLEAARREAQDGKLVLSVVAVTASWEGPKVSYRNIEVQAQVGDWFVRDLPEGAILRAALGFQTARGFRPLAVALEAAAPPRSPSPISATQLARFTKEDGARSIEAFEADSYAASVKAYRQELARVLAARSRAAGVEAGVAETLATGEAAMVSSEPSVSSGGWASGGTA